MTASITRLFFLVVLLFGLLVLFTSRWTVFEAEGLRDNPNNRRSLIEELKIERGLIKAADGTVLARSRRGAGDTFRRLYPEGGLFAHEVGFSYPDAARRGLEQFYNDELMGRREGLSSLEQQLTGGREAGDDLTTAVDPRAQRAALDALGGRPGSVVALEPRTGRVRVMASVPGFDPNFPADGTARTIERLRRAGGSPLTNRSTQFAPGGEHPPGSAFKVVTAAAALDSGRFRPSSVVNGNTGKVISGTPLQNDNSQSFGDIDLTTGLTFSVNTVWAEVAETLGRGTMARYMNRFGFGARPPVDLPEEERSASGVIEGERLLPPLNRTVDIGRVGIGQGKLQATPLQMAMVVAAVANRGVLMRPRLAQRIVDRDGRVVDDVRPEVLSRVMKRSTAEALTDMMKNVVREGTGTAAALGGESVAGKTGTAEFPDTGQSQVWFVGFAPADSPRIAIAVTIERSSGTGGEVAAPIARRVLEVLL
jgi:penicillin-binding protein A